MPVGLAAMIEFILTGTAGRYFFVSWRYAAFFLYPLVIVAGMIVLAIAASHSALIHSGLPYYRVLAPALAFAIFAALWLACTGMASLRYALDDWAFARDVVHHKRPQLEERLDRFARELARLARDTDADEVVVNGNSLGAPFSIVIVDRALQLDPLFGRRGKPLHLVSTGSSLLKLALHPAAAWLREAVARVANAPGVYWVEFQALVDVINMYKVDPVVALGLPATGKPIIKIIRIRLMVDEATYKRFRLNFLRLHRQAMMGNERRYYYDYYMLCGGPIPLSEWVTNHHATVAAFAADGALTDTWQSALPENSTGPAP